MFVELLARSCFSFLRGASQPEELVERAAQLGLSGLALCDCDGLYGSVRAWKAARAQGVNHLVGAELTVEPTQEFENEAQSQFSLALLVESPRGYENLCRLITRGHADRKKGDCRCSLADVAALADGLTALVIPPERPGVSAWPTSTSASSSNRTGAFWEKSLAEAFDGHLAVAIYRHFDGFDGQRRRWVQQLASGLQIPIVATARPLYHAPERKPLNDVLHCIREGITLDEAGSRIAPNAQCYLRGEPQMLELFSDHPEWVHESGRIAARSTFDLGQLRYHFPCRLEPGQSADERLAELTWEGVGRRFPLGISEKLRQQVKKELALIKKIGVAPYFLSTHDIVAIARRRKILCQGRGSAANSAVCYALGITAVDPARSELLFERFLSEERAEPPDIDIDFEHERREEVIQEIYQIYGREQAAMVSEIVSYRGKSALREVGKVFGLSLEQVDRLSGAVSWTSLGEATDRRLAEAGFDLSDSRVAQVVALANELQGFPRHLSIHVGGFVLSSRPLYEVAPIEPAKMEGRTVIPWDKDDIDALGFFKVDVLSLGMLTAIRKALELIVASGGLPARHEQTAGTASLASSSSMIGTDPRQTTNTPGETVIDPIEVITRIPPEEPRTYEMISRGDTVGVFQIESRAQMAMLPRLQPRCFYDLVVEVAIVRPGPIQGGMVHPYLRRRNREEAITCPHPDLWPVLQRTLGVPLFQEQVMQIAIEGAGYSGGEADQLRRDMAAWKKHGRLMAHRERLLRGFARKGIEKQFGEALFEQIKGFGEYGFPESHASSFALLVYASSWQKRHYPAQFTCALLNSQPMGFYQPTSLVKDAQRHGIEVRDVCVLHSDWDCTLEPHPESRVTSDAPGAARALRLGMRLIRGLKKNAAEQIMLARRQDGSFSSLDDLVRKARLDKADTEALADAGAMEAIEPGRRNALWKARGPRTPGLFEEVESQEQAVELPALRGAEQLVLDYERKGLSVHDHPLRYYRRRLKKRGAVRAADLLYLPKGTLVCLGGIVMTRQRPATASGVVFITLEDESGTANLIVYASVFDRYDHVARNAQLLFVRGEVERDERIALPQRNAVADSNGVPNPSSGAVIHVIVRHIERLERGASDRETFSERGAASSPRRRLRARSRNFH